MMLKSEPSKLDAIIHKFCAPLFATEWNAVGGHNAQSLNATVTFIKRKGKYYAVTCHHVLEGFRGEATRRNTILSPSLHMPRMVQQLHHLTGRELRWSFHSCRDFIGEADMDNAEAIDRLQRENASRPDIAIADISVSWEILTRVRKDVGIEAIDLDSYVEPDWSNVGDVWMAFGFPNDHKDELGEHVAAPMVHIAAELQSKPFDPNREGFVLLSELAARHGWGFSGVSGGPALVPFNDDDERVSFVGLTYEGAPSKTGHESGDELVGPATIFLMCLRLTPSAFDGWLKEARFGVSFALD
ncbi:MAG TPA: hypothetical protein VGN46_14110 [Luteibacter sp.]|jgi:hypothetical protein|uniref:hypothetical protein n=1 Tax=Luteibacter sp. TaxID=1886636 RepID=UPI002F42614A